MTYKRILLKLSGEVLAGQEDDAISQAWLMHYAREIIKVHKEGVGIAVVLGGGNIYRGAKAKCMLVNRIDGDYMGMLATMINSIALYNMLVKQGVGTRLMVQIGMNNIYEPYSRGKALAYLNKGYIVIIGGGLGKPCFTTDSAASLCAIELDVDVLMKGTSVDGIYSADPKKDKSAMLYTHITFEEALEKKLKVMDMTALTLCSEARMPIIVYNATKREKLLQVLKNPHLGTLVQV